MFIFEPWPHTTCARLRNQTMASQRHLATCSQEREDSRWQEVKNVTRLRLEEVWSILITSVTVHAQLGHSELFKYGTLWARTPLHPSPTPAKQPNLAFPNSKCFRHKFCCHALMVVFAITVDLASLDRVFMKCVHGYSMNKVGIHVSFILMTKFSTCLFSK